MTHTIRRQIGRTDLIIETGDLATQSNGAVTVRIGDTVVLATAVMSDPRPDIDFLPLTVDFEERLYAIGKIPGSFFRREGRPSQEAILSARLVDRPIRPLFPKSLHNDLQVVLTVLSADRENLPEILGIIGASSAISISDIPWNGPVGATKIAYQDGEFIINPTFSETVDSQLNGIVAGTKDGIIMVEVASNEATESVVLEAISRAQDVNIQVIDMINELVGSVGKTKLAVPPGDQIEDVVEGVKSFIGDKLLDALNQEGNKQEREDAIKKLETAVRDNFVDVYEAKQVGVVFRGIVKEAVRNRILSEGVRPDGRGLSDIRPITCEVGILPRAHGSGLFNRGQTQVLTIATLGSTRMEQTLDTLSPEVTKRFIHHYNFPPFSVGETGRLFTGRRSIGHGALAERSIQPVVPGEDKFPYTIRLVSEVLSSNGSTSMASVCGSSLALMDAGVPIRCHVAGVAMGLVVGEDNRYAILSDIQGVEDMLGDMDFKVAGTANGINALQMDLKIGGLSNNILELALDQAREGRLTILEKMSAIIESPRDNLSQYAPKVIRVMIPVEKIGVVIGPGGKMIRSIIEETGATVDVNDQGEVLIGSTSDESMQSAKQRIENLTRDLQVNDIFTGKVVRLTNFGAFVELVPGKDGLLRADEMGDMADGVKVGEEVTVIIQEIDSLGRINLSRRALFAGSHDQSGLEGNRPPARNRGGFGQRREQRGPSFGGPGFRNRPPR